MKVYGITKKNFVLNPKGNILTRPNGAVSAGAAGSGVFTLTRPMTDSPIGTVPCIRKEVTTVPTASQDGVGVSLSNGYYERNTIGLHAKPNTRYILSFYARRSGGSNLFGTAFTLDSLGERTQAEVYGDSVPSTGVWTRVSCVVDTTPSTRTMKFNIYWGGNVASYPLGSYFEITGLQVEEAVAATEYFDGSMAGYSWSGTPDGSITVSNDSSFQDSQILLNATYNKILNPNFAGGGAIVDGWSQYKSGTKIVGSLLFGDNKLTVNATSLVGGNKRFGVAVAGSNTTSKNAVFIKQGDRIFARVRVDVTQLATGTAPFIYLEARRADASAVSYIDNSTVASDGYLTVRYTASEDIYFNPWYIVGVLAAGGVDYTGSSTVTLSEAFWTHQTAGEPDPPWFSGDTPGCTWEGAPNNSRSIAPILKKSRALVMTATGLKEG